MPSRQGWHPCLLKCTHDQIQRGYDSALPVGLGKKCMKTWVTRTSALSYKSLQHKHNCAKMHMEQALPCHCECHPFQLSTVWLCGLLLNYQVNQRTNWALSAWSFEPFLMDELLLELTEDMRKAVKGKEIRSLVCERNDSYTVYLWRQNRVWGRNMTEPCTF